jgi:hypothetical protein
MFVNDLTSRVDPLLLTTDSKCGLLPRSPGGDLPLLLWKDLDVLDRKRWSRENAYGVGPSRQHHWIPID